MMSPAAPPPHASVFPRIEVDEREAPPVPVAAGGFQVVRSAEIAEAEQGRRLIAQASFRAERIVADAHEQVAAYAARARADIAASHAAWYAGQAELFEARTATAIDLLCRTTGQIAEAVIAAIFERMPSLPIRTSVDIAVRLLRSEMRAHVLCHPFDIDAVSAAAAVLGASSTQTDDTVRPGELMVRDAQGEVRIDGTDALLQLLADWKTALGLALPPMPQPAFVQPPDSHERRSATPPSSAESEPTQ